MPHVQKIVWNEGMFLSPHHFQTMETYLRDYQLALFKSVCSFPWGITRILVDEEELANGTFALLQCEGVTPDGLPFEIPGSDRRPETRLIGEHFTPNLPKLDVFLGIPIERTDGPNCPLNQQMTRHQTRYFSDFVNINDQNSGENNLEVRIARTNFKILFASEVVENYSTLKIAEIIRRPNGQPGINDEYVPPCFNIQAGKHILALLRSLLDKLAGSSSNLSHTLHQKAGTHYELRADDLENFYRLGTINAFIPVLTHFYHQGRIHPETLYLALVQLAGALTSLSPQIKPGDLVPYDHNGLSNTFTILEKHITQLIGISEGGGGIKIELMKISESQVEGSLPTELAGPAAQIFLGLTANVPEQQIQNIVPQVIKMASPEQVDYLIANALPGIKLQFTSRPHPAIQLKAGYIYFKLDTSSELWQSVIRLKKIRIYAPPGISGLKLELTGIKGDMETK